MFKIVKKAIDELNPLGLLPHAPSDEFDIESRKIVAQINSNSTIDKIAEVISKVLSSAFDIKYDSHYCLSTAEKIYNSIKTDTK